MYNVPAPDFVLNDLEGNRFYLSARKEKVILLNFWSVHCLPCMEEMPLLEKMWREYKKRGAAVIGICTDPREAGYIESFLRGLEVTYPVLTDPLNKVLELYQVAALPTTFIIDRNGIIRYSCRGYAEGYIKEFESILDHLLHETNASE